MLMVHHRLLRHHQFLRYRRHDPFADVAVVVGAAVAVDVAFENVIIVVASTYFENVVVAEIHLAQPAMIAATYFGHEPNSAFAVVYRLKFLQPADYSVHSAVSLLPCRCRRHQVASDYSSCSHKKI